MKGDFLRTTALAALVAAGLSPAARADDGDRAGRPGTVAFDEKVLAAFPNFDKDADGRLSAEEFPLEPIFKRLDVNGDGFLTVEEIREVIARARKEQEKDGDGKDGKDGKGGKGAKDGNGGKGGKDGKDRGDDGPAPDMDGGRMDAARAREIIETDPRWNPDARRRDFLRSFDRDPKDGKVERKEYAGADGDSVFRKFDRDRDGALDDRELLVLMKDQIADLEKERRHPTRGQFHYLFDLDRDNRVTKEEYALLRGPASAFNEYDVDRDGVVGYDEVRYPARYAGRDRREAAAAAPENRSVWDLYDKDGDRRVSLEEFGGSESVFRRLDRNGDGWLTLADG